jgi:rubredoxin
MQIETGDTVCPACGAAALTFHPVLHHMVCAYIGPQYDFDRRDDSYTCPKCRRAVVSNDRATEIVGVSARCGKCEHEMVVSPPAPGG